MSSKPDNGPSERGFRTGMKRFFIVWSSSEAIGWLLVVLGVCLVAVLGRYWRSELTMVWQTPWLAVASLLPAVLVLNHGMFVQSQPQKLRIRGDANGDRDAASQLEISHRLESLIREEFGRWAMTINYYLPTLALAFAGVVLAMLACRLPDCCGEIDEETVDGIRFGALGAYSYVLMTLSERTFRRDISPGLAQWSAAQLILGPIFGGVLAATLLSNTQLSQFTRQILYFVAGLAPRQIVAVFSDVATRFWSGGAEVRPAATIPLSTIGGLTSRVQERLFEEGIEDVHQLAMANPISLLRDTPYEVRQVSTWIDKALLISTLPESAALLQKEGVTGSIDLAYYYDLLNAPDGSHERIKELAQAAHISPASLAETIRRLREDRQVQLVWALYQAEPGDD